MTKAKHHIEQMQARLNRVAKREQMLIEALSQALSDADRKLLDDVRAVTIEHEARRSVILTELHSLAARIGAFPAPEDQLPMIEDDALDLPFYADDEEPVSSVPPVPPMPVAEPDKPSNGADWRKAAENIRDGLDFAIGPRRAAS